MDAFMIITIHFGSGCTFLAPVAGTVWFRTVSAITLVGSFIFATPVNVVLINAVLKFLLLVPLITRLTSTRLTSTPMASRPTADPPADDNAKWNKFLNVLSAVAGNCAQGIALKKLVEDKEKKYLFKFLITALVFLKKNKSKFLNNSLN